MELRGSGEAQSVVTVGVYLFWEMMVGPRTRRQEGWVHPVQEEGLEVSRIDEPLRSSTPRDRQSFKTFRQNRCQNMMSRPQSIVYIP